MATRIFLTDTVAFCVRYCQKTTFARADQAQNWAQLAQTDKAPGGPLHPRLASPKRSGPLILASFANQASLSRKCHTCLI